VLQYVNDLLKIF